MDKKITKFIDESLPSKISWWAEIFYLCLIYVIQDYKLLILYWINIYLSFMNGVSEVKVVRWKVSIKGRKTLPARICMGGWVSVNVSVLKKEFNNFWRNKCFLMKFLGQSNSVKVIFGWGLKSAGLKGTGLIWKWAVCRKSISSLIFCPTRWHTFFETSELRLKVTERGEFWFLM